MQLKNDYEDDNTYYQSYIAICVCVLYHSCVFHLYSAQKANIWKKKKKKS